ncbi:hypothetical protein S7711_06085 [Stachybotrys chartarum IBT 7711]|uniref:Carrier domain-containing protein n=1 Tax=Stachybotrys chartarum (strain CBS 109288 / IBT 7711) TaxID=1280523 RepID=A0A084B8J6_STACB|nr:hypothetical protein S7711_06085 [Stachybotrys chartarum IBT 7711]
MAKPDNRIAVIGMACRLPGGADSPESLWSLLAEGRDGRREVPRDRWDWKSFYNKNPDAQDATNFSHAYFLNEDVSAFDARFFNIPATDAAATDPQQRLLLEVSYEALENAGLPMESLRGSDTSVHVGMFARDFDRMGYKDMAQIDRTHIIGAGEAIMSNRISYALDLKGSSSTVDTGCSGGLVALHQACQTLRAGEATVALAGASQLLLSPEQSSIMSQLTNKDGRCFTFDDRGAGYARGEGIGVLVLKRLDETMLNGDHIHAVIVESGTGHDGKTAGIFLPNGNAQEALARSVYARAGLDPRETLFVEAHGTGTVAGDNAEIGSIARVFGREAGRASDLPVGSIKTNIGHLEAVSGIASTIKAIMVLKMDQIPPQLNFVNPKPSLRLQERGIKIPLELTPLTPQGHTGPKRVSVNSFGYGGTNAHAILEAYEPCHLPVNGHTNSGEHQVNRVNHEHDSESKLIVLSANSEFSLAQMVSDLRQWLATERDPSTSFADLVYTLNERRSKLPWRCSVISSDFQGLEQELGDSKLRPIKSARDVCLGFVFTGQGAQWFAMGRELLAGFEFQDFAHSVAASNQAIKLLGCEWDLIDELSRDEESSRLGEARFAQPVTTAVQVALVDLLATYGVRPQAVCGHSSGEVAAAYAAGALTREAAMRVAYMRGICSAEAKSLNATAGGMLAVGEDETAVLRRIEQLGDDNGRVTVACVNSPESTTVSGDLSAVLDLQELLSAASVFNRRLMVDSAYHSHHMEAVASSYFSSLDGLVHGTPREDVAFYSSVTGARKQSGFEPSYWVSNLVSQVKFSAAAQLLAQHLSVTQSTTTTALVEIGPHAALSGPLRQSLSDSSFKLASGATFKYNYLPCLVRRASAADTTLALLGKLFEFGFPLALDRGDASKNLEPKRRVVGSLPSYPWDHSKTYWRESRLSKANRQRPFPPHDLLGVLEVGSSIYEPRWRYHVSLSRIPWIRDHIIEGFIVFPGAGYLVMVIEAMKQLFQLRKTPGRITTINLRDIIFAKPVFLQTDTAKQEQEVEVQLTISPSRQHTGSSWEHFRIVSYDAQNDSWNDNCNGLVSWESASAESPSIQAEDEQSLDARDDGLGHFTEAAANQWMQDVIMNCSESLDVKETYNEMKAAGNEYGPTFQGLKEIHIGRGYATGRVVVPNIAQQMPDHYIQPHTIHPSTFDSLFHLEPICFRREGLVAPIMPTVLGEVSVVVDMDSAPDTEIEVGVQRTQLTPHDSEFSFVAYQKRDDGTLRPVITGTDIRIQVVGEATSKPGEQKKMTYRMDWKPDLDSITEEHILALTLSLSPPDRRANDRVTETNLTLNDKVAAIFIHRAIKRMKEDGVFSESDNHLSGPLNWIIDWEATEAVRLLDGVAPEDENSLIEHNSNSNDIMGLAMSCIGPHYFDILTGNSSAQELLSRQGLLERLCSEHTPFESHYTQISVYLDALVHKTPGVDALIVNTGSEVAIAPISTAMGRLTAQLTYQTLDMSRDPFEQGYTTHSFDLIVAPLMRQSTPQLDETLVILRKLLKPGGRLVLMELTAHEAAHDFVFGTLGGWWESKKNGRGYRSRMSIHEWNECLRENGFSGTDLVIPAYEGHGGSPSAVIIAQALPLLLETADSQSQNQEAQEKTITATVYLGCSSDESQIIFGDALCRSMDSAGLQCSREAWSTKPAATQNQPGNSFFIVIDSAEKSLLLDPSHEIFGQLKELLLQGGGNILWVSYQSSSPSRRMTGLRNMASGMARVLRRENEGLNLTTVDIQDPLPSGNDKSGLQSIVHMLCGIAMRSFPFPKGAPADGLKLEREYAISGGKVQIPRVIPDDCLATHIANRNHPDQENSGSVPLVNCQYHDKTRFLKFDIQVPGLLQSIRFVDNDDMLDSLGPEDVQIQAMAHGVNYQDAAISLRQMPPGSPMTGEVAGVITAVGSNVQSWKIGDRVTALSVTPYGNHVRSNSKSLAVIPDRVTFAEAASIPLAFFTAWHCLHRVARVEKGQSVLIHEGSGGVGQAAIQLAQRAGAEVFATVGSDADRELLRKQYNLPINHIILLDSKQLKKKILGATHGKGVDVVLNSLSGRLLRDSWDCLAPFGTFCEIGKADIHGGGQLSMAKFDKQATFAAVDASYMHRMRPEMVSRGVKDIFGMIEEGSMRPVYPVTAIDISRIEEAFHLVAEKRSAGKLVLIASEQTVVRAPRAKTPELRLQREGTYIIGGGLGDLGKRTGRFLAQQGAGHIVALTRRDANAVAQQPAVVEMQEAIRQLGGTLHIVQCDIGNKQSTQEAADRMAELGIPPVRGIIQSAAVLRDHPLEYMEADDWNTSIRPKVHGTLNMHECFCSSETTDFFVMLSSVSSIIGTVSQSNYAAGNAFLDAFARSRAEFPSGITRYATINVGAVEGSELVAGAMQQGADVVHTVGSVSFDDVLAAIEYAISSQARDHQEVAQHLMHFNRDTMEDAFGLSALSDPLYNHIPSSKGQGGNAVLANKNQSILQSVEQSGTLAEAEELVRQALLDKFIAFIGDDIPDVPIAALGLDSLVSIELKNWVKHTFRAPLQISELSNAQSMLALAKVVVSRMDLAFHGADGHNPKVDLKAQDNGTTNDLVVSQLAEPHVDRGDIDPGFEGHGQVCCRFAKELPVQPLPELGGTLDYWLGANQHLLSPEQLESVNLDFEAMRASNSPARQILQDLYSRHAHDKTNGWLTKIVTEGRFLCRRAPVAPWTSIMAAQSDNSGKRHSQSERAAIITSAALAYRQAMRAGEIAPLEIAGRPECTWGWEWLFNSTRIPQASCDKVLSYAPSPDTPDFEDSIAVLRKGRVFKVKLQDGSGKDRPLGQFQADFESILDRVEDKEVHPTLLTTDERDSWAQIRESLLALDPGNVEYFHVLDSAMFVLCLDDGSPETPEEIARQGYIGDGRNRWFDKVLQFYVSANGRSGILTEHGILDGTAATRLLEWVARAMEAYPAGLPGHDGQANGVQKSVGVEPKEMVLHITPAIEEHARLLGDRYKQATSTSTYVREQLHEFGTNFLLQRKVPSKGVIDLTFQLALRLFFGKNMASWEPTSGAIFHAGRADALQRATPAVNKFCDAAATMYQTQDTPSNLDVTAELRSLLLAAAKSLNASMQVLFTGRGSQRVFEVLAHLWPTADPSNPKPAFLADMVFFGRPSPPIFAQTNSLEGEVPVEDFVHLMPDTDGFWAFICPEKDRISISLTGGSQERTGAFVDELHRAARIMRDIIGNRA